MFVVMLNHALQASEIVTCNDMQARFSNQILRTSIERVCLSASKLSHFYSLQRAIESVTVTLLIICGRNMVCIKEMSIFADDMLICKL